MKLNMANKRIIYTLVVTGIIVFSTTFAVLMALERMDYRNYLQAEYSKNMYELINNVENIQDNLTKSAICGTKEQCMIVFQEIFRYASKANDNISSLPVTQQATSETNKFLSQVGDYCYTLMRSTSEGKELTDEDYNTIDRLSQESFQLKEQLNSVLADINKGKVKWSEVRKKATGVFAKEESNPISEKFTNIQKQITEYPVLIYDGPFSDNNLEITPKVNNEKEISQAEAEDIVKKVVGVDKVESIGLKDTKAQTRIEAFSFNVKVKGRSKDENISCEVSKKGGKIVYLLDNRKLGKPTLDENKATETGIKFLGDNGYKSMIPSYTLKYEDSITVNYVYHMNDVIVYPDQIKLKIALDDGSIIGIESEKYLISHEDNRNLPTVKISQEEGRKKIGKKLTINTIKLTVIPTLTNKEILCYEYAGTYKDDKFMVYINTQTGEEEKIIKIINTPNGQLAM